MPDESEVIAKIEKPIGKKLKEFPHYKISEIDNGFSLGDGGRVVGLNLSDCKLTDISAFLQVSCLDRRGIDELNRTIREVLGRMPHLKDTLPKSWQDIRKKLDDFDDCPLLFP